jgi:N-acyl-D-aspartate/D-glutamate deacylase
MEGVEDIPGTVLAEGVKFDWESFPEYLQALEAAPKALDIGAQVPHGVLRFYVMGERGADHAQAPTDAEIAQMGALLEEALKAGARGFTTSRTTKHRAKDGRLTPSLSAREPELLGLAAAMKRAGRGVIEVNSDFGPGEFEVLRAAAEVSGRPLSVLLLQEQRARAVARHTRSHPCGAQGRHRRQRTGRVPSDRRDDGARNNAQSVRDASGMESDASSFSGRAVSAAEERLGATPRADRAAPRRRVHA